MNRVNKPLDVGGLRLYQVKLTFTNHPQWNDFYIVAAHTPTGAANLIRALHKNSQWIEEPSIDGYALNVYQPAAWHENYAELTSQTNHRVHELLEQFETAQARIIEIERDYALLREIANETERQLTMLRGSVTCEYCHTTWSAFDYPDHHWRTCEKHPARTHFASLRDALQNAVRYIKADVLTEHPEMLEDDLPKLHSWLGDVIRQTNAALAMGEFEHETIIRQRAEQIYMQRKGEVAYGDCVADAEIELSEEMQND